VVFGSQAKGTATEESAIDIKKFLVLLDIITLTPEEHENRTSLAAEYAYEGEIVIAG